MQVLNLNMIELERASKEREKESEGVRDYERK